MVDVKDAWARQSKAARELLRWKQEDLAKKTGLSPGTIRNFESGLTPHTVGTTAAIREVFEKAGIQFVLKSENGITDVGVILAEAEKPK
jgi:transcriptional regulator with XRE-family HTH domain